MRKKAAYLLLIRSDNERIQISHQRILQHQTTRRHTQHHPQTSPQDKRARHDRLFRLLTDGQNGHEGARKLESLAHTGRHQEGQVEPRGHVFRHYGKAGWPEEHEGGAEDDGPLEAARPGDQKAGADAGDGGGDGGDEEVQAGGGGGFEEDGLEEDGDVEEDGVDDNGREEVGEDEVRTRRVCQEAERHDGAEGMEFGVDEQRGADEEDDEGRCDDGVSPRIDVASESLVSLDKLRRLRMVLTKANIKNVAPAVSRIDPLKSKVFIAVKKLSLSSPSSRPIFFGTSIHASIKQSNNGGTALGQY